MALHDADVGEECGGMSSVLVVVAAVKGSVAVCREVNYGGMICNEGFTFSDSLPGTVSRRRRDASSWFL